MLSSEGETLQDDLSSVVVIDAVCERLRETMQDDFSSFSSLVLMLCGREEKGVCGAGNEGIGSISALICVFCFVLCAAFRTPSCLIS